MYLLLDEQWVMSNVFSDESWNVCEGSGMGLLHSGVAADLAHCNRAEQGWAARPYSWVARNRENLEVPRRRSGACIRTLEVAHPRARHDQPSRLLYYKNERKSVMTKIGVL